jgi:hypothetical protein
MVQLIVTKEEALLKLRSIFHQTCQKGIENYWHVNANDSVNAQSVCWLYCWAKTGMGSDKAKLEAQEAFNTVLNINFNDFDTCPDAYEWARKRRCKKGDIDKEITEYLDESL